VSVEQGQRSPVTEYFFWPRKDAWEELKAALDSRGWIGDREKVLLLNQCTEVRAQGWKGDLCWS
jgi:30S ribosomal protein 3